MAATSSSSTITVEAAPAAAPAPAKLTLKLRARRRVRWEDGTVDNEELGRKKSKCCCQFHRKRAFDESSDESGDDDLDVRCHDADPPAEPSGEPAPSGTGT